MPPKTAEEELAELEMLAEAPAAPPPKSKGPKTPRQRQAQADAALKDLEDLENLGKFTPEVPRPSSRPNTPKPSATSSSTASSNRRGIATPSSSGSARTSEDKAAVPRKSGESARSYHQSFAPTAEEPATVAPVHEEPKQAGSWWGGGWGGLISTATEAANAAKKQAEAAYQEIQKNQEAQRWAEQVRGNVGALRGIGASTSALALLCYTVLTRYRRRIGQSRPPHIHKHPQHPRPAHLAT